MASYKVPQDVEADDKLIGPFSFRQFIYLIIVALALGLAFILSRLFIGLAVIPLPIVIFFGALALPLRKDQPMETYLAAIVSFYVKPRKRLWTPDGQQSLIQIVAARTTNGPQLKDLSQNEADRRFSYLANIVDSQGWAVRGVSGMPNTSLNDDVYYEAQRAEDILDESNRTSQIIDTRLDQAAVRHREELVARMHQPPATQQPAPTTPQPIQDNVVSQVPQPPMPQQPVPQQPQAVTTADPHLVYNPYPNSIQQKVVQPYDQSAQQTNVIEPQAETPSEKPLSPDILNLASNPDLSVETISREANRIKAREGSLDNDEVVISLH